MAIAAATVWEVRPSVGNDNNGGGFVAGASGTDYSQQNAAQYTFSDLTVDATTNTKVTSSGHSFVAADVGNIMHITAGTGFTAGFYQIVSVASGAATLDSSPAATSTSGGTYAVGGALNTISQAFNAAVSCNQIWIKNTGTYTATSAIALTTSLNSGGSTTGGSAFRVSGYGTTRGDNTHISWTTATNSINLVSWSMSAAQVGGFIWENIDFSTTAVTPGAGFFIANNGGRVYNCSFINCTFNGFTSAISAINGNTSSFPGLYMQNCEVKNCTSQGIRNASGVFVDCFIHDNTSHGILIGAGSTELASFVTLIRTTMYNNGADGLTQNGSLNGSGWLLINSNFVNNTSHGVSWESGQASPGMGPIIISNCIFVSNGGYGINTTVAIGTNDALVTFVGTTNAFYNNTSGQINGNITNMLTSTDITLTGTPFNSPSTGDFTLNSTTGEGAACKGAGYQGTLAGA